ncbi:MAG: oxidoreductase [Deltaproteobacteria bacterium]|nr:oxidoreductase [Deltaproteobacteria bacterium]
MKRWNLIIDVEKCEDCNNCFLSCKDEHVNNDWPGYTLAQPRHGHRWINIMRKERGQFPLIDVAYRPTPCMHCDRAPCIEAAGDGSVHKREDGIVLIDPVKAKGRRDLLKACPYGAIWWNEELGVPQKCTLCSHLLDAGWEKPRCVQACPTGALRILRVEDPEMKRIVGEEGLEVLHSEYDTAPRVYYKNLYLFEKCFIGGSVAFERKGIKDCAAGAEITLRKDATEIARTCTDAFGDFKFDRLEENSGKYVVEIKYREHAPKTLEVELTNSVNVGTIVV